MDIEAPDLKRLKEHRDALHTLNGSEDYILERCYMGGEIRVPRRNLDIGPVGNYRFNDVRPTFTFRLIKRADGLHIICDETKTIVWSAFNADEA